MIYNFNHGIGWASSGVEYAQSYRNKILNTLGIETRFVFTDMFLSDNLSDLTNNLGFDDKQIIWLYLYFTDIKVAPTTFTIKDLENELEEGYELTREGKVCRFMYSATGDYYTAYMVNDKEDFVHRVEVVKGGFLVRKDYYSYCRMFSEYYGPLDGSAHLYQRRFWNENGSIAYEEFIDGDNVMYKFPNEIFDSKEELVGYMVRSMELSSSDIVIVDRSTDIGQPILQNVKNAKVGIVIHADHFSENGTDDDNILWNNYYEYAFAQHKLIDFYIASTDVQRDIVKEQFEKYMNVDVNVITIPVGSIDELKYPYKARRKHGLITASRLATEKHVDWIAEAVVRVHEKYPDVTLDIYGKGSEAEKIQGIINKNDAGGYIKLCGHHKLDDIYAEYEAYVSASGSEGFGLTLLEAIGSGLPLVGYDVRYGNQTFIADGENGYLIPIEDMMNSDEKINLLADAIEKLFESNLDEFSRKSYEIAERYLTSEVEKAWQKLVEAI